MPCCTHRAHRHSAPSAVSASAVHGPLSLSLPEPRAPGTSVKHRPKSPRRTRVTNGHGKAKSPAPRLWLVRSDPVTASQANMPFQVQVFARRIINNMQNTLLQQARTLHHQSPPPKHPVRRHRPSAIHPGQGVVVNFPLRPSQRFASRKPNPC